MSLLALKRVFAAKVEGTIGTAETLTGAEGAFNAYGTIIKPTVPVEPREHQGGFNKRAGVKGAQMGVATFKTDLAWDGTATLPTWASVLLPACGFVNNSGTFTPRTEAPGSNVKTVTIGCFMDGSIVETICGAMGDFRIVMPAGQVGFIEWTFTGVYKSVASGSLITPTYPTAPLIRYANSATTFNSVGLQNENFTFAAGNSVVMLEGQTVEGYTHAVVSDRNPRYTSNPLSVLLATQNRYTAWLDSTEAVLSVTLAGPSTSTIVISSPKAQILNKQPGERNKIVIDELEFAANANGSTVDQEVSIAFTPSA